MDKWGESEKDWGGEIRYLKRVAEVRAQPFLIVRRLCISIPVCAGPINHF